jgi:hypothetical protein
MNLWRILTKHGAPTFWFMSRTTKRLGGSFNYLVWLVWLINLWGSLGFFGMLRGFPWPLCLFVSFLLWILQNFRMSFFFRSHLNHRKKWLFQKQKKLCSKDPKKAFNVWSNHSKSYIYYVFPFETMVIMTSCYFFIRIISRI